MDIQIDVCQWFGDGLETTVLYPRLVMGETLSKELQRALGGKAWVNFDPSATFVSVILRNGEAQLDEVKQQVAAFLNSYGCLPPTLR